MTHTRTEYATYGCYVFLGASMAVVAFCKGVELLNEAWRVTPRQKLRVGK